MCGHPVRTHTHKQHSMDVRSNFHEVVSTMIRDVLATTGSIRSISMIDIYVSQKDKCDESATTHSLPRFIAFNIQVAATREGVGRFPKLVGEVF